MLLYSYISLATISLIFTIISLSSKKISSLTVLVVIIAWSFMLRMSEPSADIISYTFIMTSDFDLINVGGVLTQPVLWFFHYYLYRLTESVLFSWVAGDILLLSLFYYAVKKLNEGLHVTPYTAYIKQLYPAIFFILIVSWPYFLGLSLTYRQFAATVLFLCAIANIRSSFIKGTIFFVLSIFTHNGILFFAPILGLLAKSKILRFLSIVFSITVLPVAFNEAQNFTESRFVGVLLAASYPVITILISGFMSFLVINQRISVSRELVVFALYMPYVTTLGWLLLPNGLAERMGLFSMAISLPVLLIFIADKFEDRRSVLIAALVCVLVPTVTFYSSMF